MATIVIVDDHELFRGGTKVALNSIGEHEIFEAANGKEFLEILKYVSPDIVLMDINMPIMNGIEATEKALADYPDLKIIILSMLDNAEYYNTLIDLGVKGFLLKENNIDECKIGIQRILDGHSYFSQDLLLRLMNKIKKTSITLTNREQDVLNLIAKGYSTQEIAKALFISFKTVDRHRSNLLSKTNTNSSLKLLIFAVQNGMVKI